MGKPKNYVKEETVKRLKTLLKKYNSREELLTSKEFQSLCNHYINGFEKEHLDSIISLCEENKSYDEIRFIIGGTTMKANNDKNVTSSAKKNTKSKATNSADPVEEEAMFIVSQQKVVESEPVQIIIPEYNNEDDDNQADTKDSIMINQNDVPEGINVDESDDVDNPEPVILSKLTKNKNSKSSKQNNNSVVSDDGKPGLIITALDAAMAVYCKGIKNICAMASAED